VGASRQRPFFVDEHDAAQHPPIIHPRLAVAAGKERSQPLHLLTSQPKQGLIPLSLRSLNNTVTLTSMGPNPTSMVRVTAAYTPRAEHALTRL